METSTATILEVNSKEVNTKNGPKPVYNIKASDGKEYSTFKRQLGQKAGELRGQTATLGFSTVVKGDYTNYYLEAVEASASQPETVVVQGNGVTHNITPKTFDDKSEQINRAVAFKAAVELVSSGYVETEPGKAIEAVAKLTKALVPVVDGSYSPFEAGQSKVSDTGDIGAGEVEGVALVDF